MYSFETCALSIKRSSPAARSSVLLVVAMGMISVGVAPSLVCWTSIDLNLSISTAIDQAVVFLSRTVVASACTAGAAGKEAPRDGI